MLILRRTDVTDVLSGRETEIIDLVADTYRLHDEGRTSLPHSTFLRFPEEHHTRDRIIGLPAYRGGERPAAGMKWIASFPGNVAAGTERASAAILLNSLDHGRPVALVEGAVVSAKRTAASAALAAAELTAERPPASVLLVGCGVINLEILRFLAAALPGLTEAALYDTDPARAEEFARRPRPRSRPTRSPTSPPRSVSTGSSRWPPRPRPRTWTSPRAAPTPPSCTCPCAT